MKDILILFLTGTAVFVLGILVLRRDKRLYRDSVFATAKLVKYYEYSAPHNNATMFTMEVDYKTMDGTIVHAKEQGGTNHPKYKIGDEIEIYYSKEKPEMFLLCGDNSRKYALYGMTVLGLFLIGLSVCMLFTGGAK